MSALGHFRPKRSALVPDNVRFAPKATNIVQRRERPKADVKYIIYGSRW